MMNEIDVLLLKTASKAFPRMMVCPAEGHKLVCGGGRSNEIVQEEGIVKS
jgi:hypothetical protein